MQSSSEPENEQDFSQDFDLIQRAFEDGVIDGVRGWSKDLDGCIEYGMDDSYNSGYLAGELLRKNRSSQSDNQAFSSKVQSVEEAFLRLCEALGIAATPNAYLEVPALLGIKDTGKTKWV